MPTESVQARHIPIRCRPTRVITSIFANVSVSGRALAAAYILEKTVLFVSHRLSTVVKADEIIVLDKGKVIEIGTHSNLMTRNGKYAEMFRKQAENYIGE